MTKGMTTNQDLENYLINGEVSLENKPWHGLDPTAKRVGNKAFSIVCNEYEKVILSEAATKDDMTLAGFIRQASLKRAKVILDIK